MSSSLDDYAKLINTLLASGPEHDMEISMTIMHDMNPMLQKHMRKTGETTGQWVARCTNLTDKDSRRMMGPFMDLYPDEEEAMLAARRSH